MAVPHHDGELSPTAYAKWERAILKSRLEAELTWGAAGLAPFEYALGQCRSDRCPRTSPRPAAAVLATLSDSGAFQAKSERKR